MPLTFANAHRNSKKFGDYVISMRIWCSDKNFKNTFHELVSGDFFYLVYIYIFVRNSSLLPNSTFVVICNSFYGCNSARVQINIYMFGNLNFIIVVLLLCIFSKPLKIFQANLLRRIPSNVFSSNVKISEIKW